MYTVLPRAHISGTTPRNRAAILLDLACSREVHCPLPPGTAASIAVSAKRSP